MGFQTAEGSFWSFWRIGQAIFTAVLVAAGLLTMITYGGRLTEPLGEVTGQLGPLESSRLEGELTNAVTVLTTDGELLFVRLQNNGRILEHLQSAEITEPVTIQYQGETAVSLQTTQDYIEEYPFLNNWLIWLFLLLTLVILLPFLFPIYVENILLKTEH